MYRKVWNHCLIKKAWNHWYCGRFFKNINIVSILLMTISFKHNNVLYLYNSDLITCSVRASHFCWNYFCQPPTEFNSSNSSYLYYITKVFNTSACTVLFIFKGQNANQIFIISTVIVSYLFCCRPKSFHITYRQKGVVYSTIFLRRKIRPAWYNY